MIAVEDVAKYLLSLFKEDAEKRVVGGDEVADISNLKLQKLLYYCQAYSYALMGKPMFAEDMEAWDYGPVVPSIYQEYKKYGRRNRRCGYKLVLKATLGEGKSEYVFIKTTP